MYCGKRYLKNTLLLTKRQVRKGQFVVNDRELVYLLRDKQVNFLLTLLSDRGSVPVKCK